MKKIIILLALLAVFLSPHESCASAYSTTLSADGSECFATAKKYGDQNYMATVYASGTWGSGTIAWKLSFDGGVSAMALKDLTGVAVTSTADDIFNINLGNAGGAQDDIQVCVTLSGATNPDITVGLFDNN